MSWDTPLLSIIDNFTPSSLSLASQNYLHKQFLSSSWRFYSHPFNILLYLTVKWPPLIACLCLAAAAVAAVLWTNIRGNYVEIKIYMKHCGCWGKFSYFWCCFINDLGDICKSAQSFWFRGCVHQHSHPAGHGIPPMAGNYSRAGLFFPPCACPCVSAPSWSFPCPCPCVSLPTSIVSSSIYLTHKAGISP